MYEEELRPKHVVSDCCDKIFNMIKEDFPLAVIINCYFRMCKNVKSNHTKCLKDETLKNAMMADIKKCKKSRALKTSKRVTN